MDGATTIESGGIGVTEAAFSRLGAILDSEGASKLLRVAVLGGGCSGFQYTFELDEAVAEDDVVIERGRGACGGGCRVATLPGRRGSSTSRTS